MSTARSDQRRLYDRDSYHYARSLGLCGRCKKRDALPEMAYCRECHAACRAYNERRQGIPVKRYRSKFVIATAQTS